MPITRSQSARATTCPPKTPVKRLQQRPKKKQTQEEEQELPLHVPMVQPSTSTSTTTTRVKAKTVGSKSKQPKKLLLPKKLTAAAVVDVDEEQQNDIGEKKDSGVCLSEPGAIHININKMIKERKEQHKEIPSSSSAAADLLSDKVFLKDLAQFTCSIKNDYNLRIRPILKKTEDFKENLNKKVARAQKNLSKSKNMKQALAKTPMAKKVKGMFRQNEGSRNETQTPLPKKISKVVTIVTTPSTPQGQSLQLKQVTKIEQSKSPDMFDSNPATPEPTAVNVNVNANEINPGLPGSPELFGDQDKVEEDQVTETDEDEKAVDADAVKTPEKESSKEASEIGKSKELILNQPVLEKEKQNDGKLKAMKFNGTYIVNTNQTQCSVVNETIVIEDSPPPPQPRNMMNQTVVIDKRQESSRVMNQTVIINKTQETKCIMNETVVINKRQETSSIMNQTVVLDKRQDSKKPSAGEIVIDIGDSSPAPHRIMNETVSLPDKDQKNHDVNVPLPPPAVNDTFVIDSVKSKMNETVVINSAKPKMNETVVIDSAKLTTTMINETVVIEKGLEGTRNLGKGLNLPTISETESDAININENQHQPTTPPPHLNQTVTISKEPEMNQNKNKNVNLPEPTIIHETPTPSSKEPPHKMVKLDNLHNIKPQQQQQQQQQTEEDRLRRMIEKEEQAALKKEELRQQRIEALKKKNNQWLQKTKVQILHKEAKQVEKEKQPLPPVPVDKSNKMNPMNLMQKLNPFSNPFGASKNNPATTVTSSTVTSSALIKKPLLPNKNDLTKLKIKAPAESSHQQYHPIKPTAVAVNKQLESFKDREKPFQIPEPSGGGDESFHSAIMETSLNESTLNNYNITVYEEYDDDMTHRKDKKIPAWAKNSGDINRAIVFQLPIFTPPFPKFVFPKGTRDRSCFPKMPTHTRF